MIQNYLVFCINNNVKFVDGSIPSGKITANSINKNSIFTITPFAENTIIKAVFQPKDRAIEPMTVWTVPTDKVKPQDLINPNKSYYELVKDWYVREVKIPSLVLEYISSARNTEIGITFFAQQRVVPQVPQSLTFDGYLEQETPSIAVGTYKIVKPTEMVWNDLALNFNDVVYNTSGTYKKINAIQFADNTTTVLYGVDPAILNDNFEYIDPTTTDLILEKLGELETNIDILNLQAIKNINGAETQTTETNVSISGNSRTVSVDVKLDPKTGNLITKNINGLLVDKQEIIDIIKDEVNPLVDVSINNSTYVMTFYFENGNTKQIDLPVENMIINVTYDPITKDLTFNLQNGTTLVVPLDDLVDGLVDEAPIDGKTYARKDGTWIELTSTYVLPVMNETTLGGGKAISKTDEDKQVAVDSDGTLWYKKGSDGNASMEAINISIAPTDFIGLVANKTITDLKTNSIFSFISNDKYTNVEEQVRENAINFDNAEFIAQVLTNGILTLTVSEVPSTTIYASILIFNTEAELNDYIEKSSAINVVYVNDGSGNPSTIIYSYNADNNTIVRRTSNGTIKGVTAVANDDLTTKLQVDNALSLKVNIAGNVTITGTKNFTGTLLYQGEEVATVEDLSTVFKYMGSVATYANLPTTDRRIGDVWNVSDTGKNFAWSGTAWDDLGGIVDLSNYYTKAQIDTLLNGKLDKVITTTTHPQVYFKEANGNQGMRDFSALATPNAIAQRNALGQLEGVDATASTQLATKGQMDTSVNAKLDKVSGVTSNKQTYTKNVDGTQEMVDATYLPTQNTYALRTTNGRLKVGTAVENDEAVTKLQLDTIVGDIETLLEAL